MSVRVVPLAVGVVTTVAGIVLWLSGGLGGVLPVEIVLIAATLVAATVGVAGLLVRSVQGPSTDALRDPTERPGVRRPGDDVDRSLSELTARELRARTDVPDRVETVAVDLFSRRLGCSRERAREHLSDGDWTADADVRAFFERDLEDGSLREQLGALLSGESPVYRQLSAVTAELVRFGRREP